MSQANNVRGVSEYKVDYAISDVKRLLSLISQKVDRLERTVSSTKSFYLSDSSYKFRSSYDRIKDDFTVMGKNILSYTNDLARMKQIFKSSTVAAADTVFNSAKKEYN